MGHAKTSSCLGRGLWSPETRDAKTSSRGTWFLPASCTAPSVARNMLTALPGACLPITISFYAPLHLLTGPAQHPDYQAWLSSPHSRSPRQDIAVNIVFCKQTLQEEEPLLRTNNKGKDAPPAFLRALQVQGVWGFNVPSPEVVWPLAGCRYMTTDSLFPSSS